MPMNNAVKKTVAIFNLLARNTFGNGEVVGTLVVTGLAVVAGAAAAKSLGEASESAATGQAGKINDLPGAGGN